MHLFAKNKRNNGEFSGGWSTDLMHRRALRGGRPNSVALADTLSEHVRIASSLKNADVQHALVIVSLPPVPFRFYLFVAQPLLLAPADIFRAFGTLFPI